MPMLQEGDIAPHFDLPDDTGNRLDLAAMRGRAVALYFYPKDDTEGCTIEAVEFSKLIKKFERAGTLVIGLSPDSAKSHAKFKCKHELALKLASDADLTAAKAYGVWVEKSMYGRKFMGVERSTFLIDAEGRIAAIWRKVAPRGHAEVVLEAARALKRAESGRR